MKRLRFLPFIAFLMTLASFLLFLTLYGVLGFGNNTILRGDLFVQYIDFIKMFLRVLKGEEDFWYSFSIYYGSGTILTYAYYVLSPFNLLYLIEAVPIPVMTIIVISTKIGLAASSFSVFSRKILKCDDRLSLLFAVCYAMNGFAVTFHFNIIWLDSVFILPLVILLLFRLADTGRFLALVPAWAYLFLTNFYMAYIVGIFSALTFLCILALRMPSRDFSAIKKAATRLVPFVLSVVLAAGISAAILLPCALFLISHMAADNAAFTPLPTVIFDIVNSLFVGSMPDIDNRTPLMYCGLPILLCLPFYFSSKKISLKEKLITGTLLTFYITGMLFLPLFVALHAFDYPNFYFFRFSFCVSFLLCTLCCRRLSFGFDDISPKHFFAWIAFLICFYSFMTGFGPLNSRSFDSDNTPSLMALNILFISLWSTIFLLLNKNWLSTHFHRIAATIFTSLLLIIELALNGSISMTHTNTTPISEEEYNIWLTSEETVLSRIPENDTDLFRVAMYGGSNYNSPSLFGYNGFNTFSSSDDYELRSALYDLGISGTNRCITENGYTDLTYLLFSAAYKASIRRLSPTSEERETLLDSTACRLPIAYMVSDSINDYLPGDDPFDNQELLVNAMTDDSWHFYDRLALSDVELSSYNASMYDLKDHYIFYRKTDRYPTSGVYFSVPRIKDKPFYACFRQTIPSADATAPYVLADDRNFAVSTTLSQGCLYAGGNPMGSFSADTETVVIYFAEDSVADYPCGEMYFARFDPKSLSALCDELSPGGLKISSHKGGHIKGTITVPSDKTTLFTSIPMDEGWSATVDGTPVTCGSILNGAFLSLHLTPGTHEISLDYSAPGARAGAMISIVSLIITLFLFLKTLLFSPSSSASQIPDTPYQY